MDSRAKELEIRQIHYPENSFKSLRDVVIENDTLITIVDNSRQHRLTVF